MDRLRFVDLHYKGVRISRAWQDLVYRAAVYLYLCLLVLSGLFFWRHSGLSLLTPAVLWPVLLKRLILPSVVSSACFMALCFTAVPVWNYLSDLQRLCRMIYTYPLYLVRNYVSDADAEGKVRREIQYFPEFYYRRRHGRVEITVHLDGSKFHQSGAFENLTAVLEDTCFLRVVDITRRRDYLTYHLLGHTEGSRLKIGQVRPEGYGIPLMKGCVWDITQVSHGLVVGGTGGGKTYFLNTLLQAFLRMGAEVYVCDPKNSSLADYRRLLPHVAVDTDAILQGISACVGVMKERFSDIKERPDYISGQDFSHYGLPPVILLLDEYVAFASSLNRSEKETFKSGLNQLILQGREAGVFVILATQRPDTEYLSGNIRDQLGLRVALGKMTADGYRMAFGSTEQKLKSTGRCGEGYFSMTGFSFIQRFYAPLVPEGYRFVDAAEKILKEG